MSLRLEMLQVARRAPRILGDSTELVLGFLERQQNADGGFKDRSGRSDLYYTAFALDALNALQASLPLKTTADYLHSFGNGGGLDFVHLCCLVRAWTILATAGQPIPRHSLSQVLRRITAYRTPDGGFNPKPGAQSGSAYGAFLGLGAYQDLSVALPNPTSLAEDLRLLETPDGAWTNERDLPVATGSTNATAAAISVLRNLAAPIRPSAADWLLQQAHAQGGFRAVPQAPIPDLLSTATALHALSDRGVSLGDGRERCLDFVDSLWTNAGSFHGNWTDDILDCEYTFYGLLALGHLSL